MTTIDSTSRFLAQLRGRVASVARQAAATRAGPARGRAPQRQEAPAPDVQELVLRRVLAIAADDPERRRKAFRIFLETVLVDELGPELVNDPAFHAIVATVQRTLEQDDALLPVIEKAGEYLLDSARKPSAA